MPHILIVDNHARMLETLQMALGEEYIIAIAGSGQEALELVEEQAGFGDYGFCNGGNNGIGINSRNTQNGKKRNQNHPVFRPPE